MKDFLDSTNTNPDLPLKFTERLSLHQCRIDQTPSPEELPLDPIEVKTDSSSDDAVAVASIATESQQTNQPHSTAYQHEEQQLSQNDSYSKTDQMTKSSTSTKVSSSSMSFITSVTSITSLDTGYQGDGEMSRPASRGGDHSPSNVGRAVNSAAALIRPPLPALEPPGPLLLQQLPENNIPIVRRPPDPMTDSDFFTESDADDVINRGGGDRRAQVIDGHLYGPLMAHNHQGNVYRISQPTSSQTEDSCMESSGIFTDVENRGDEDLLQNRPEHDSDMSPDGSTDTVKSTIDQKKHHQRDDDKSDVKETDAEQPTVGGADRLHQHHHHSSIISDDDVIVDDNDVDVVAAAAKNEIAQQHVAAVQPPSKQSVSNRPAKAVVVTANKFVSSGGVGATTTIDKSQHNSEVKSGGSGGATTKKTSTTTTPIRKQNKNEANVALKKHELYAKSGSGSGSGGGGVGHNGAVGGCDSVKLIKALASSADSENQENKRPVLNSSASGGGGVTLLSCSASPGAGSSSSGGSLFRKPPQNKWDAVMNKIAINKTVVKPKNYSDVKSKVTCGIGRRDLPLSPGLKSPSTTTTTTTAGASNEQLLPSKRTLLSGCSSKR